MKKLLSETSAALWQGLVVLIVFVVLFSSAYAAIYWFRWGSNPHWIEGFHDRFKLPNLADNRFWLWIHQDTQYWATRVRFDEGPVVIEGPQPAARYWSVTCYPARENAFSINTQNAVLDDRGRFRITIGREVVNSVPQQAIRVDPGVRRGIVELRVTLADAQEPLVLPSVTQNGRRLIEEGRP
jgi:uncharacterized membrane protein